MSTFWKWWKKYRASERAPWGLKDNYGNCGGVPQPVCTEAFAVLQQMAVDYGTREQPSKALLLERMRNRIFALNQNRADDVKVVCPSRKQLYDHLASLQNIRVVAGRKGGDAVRRKCSPISQGMGIVLPLERVEMDHWEVHLQSVLVAIGLWDRLSRNKRRSIGRMHLCVAIDVATKVILGMHLSETPTSADAIAVVQAIVSDKSPFADAVGAALPWDMHGTPETIATDGGSAFTADDFGLAVASLRCDHIIPPGGVPSLRGTMERFFRTVHMRLISRFHGRTFENMLVRGDYPAEKLANLDTRDLAWVIVRWVVDVYHASKHDGLGGVTPRNAWLEAVELYGTTPPPDPHVRRSIFGIPLVRTLNQEGIRILGVRYWSDTLVEEFFDRGIVEIEIKLDPADIGEISVRIGRDWHAARCVRRDVAGINVETWIEAASEMRRIRGEQADFNVNVVRDAVDAIEMVGRGAADREGIANPTLTSDQIDNVERTALLGFSIPDPIAEAAAEDIDGLLAGGIPVTGTAGPLQAPLEPKTPQARRPPELIQDNPDDTDDNIFDFED
ncbi:Mu transposase C-terminal domain-containing protein [Methylobacterium sp. J-059]|uniref:Mu transposase C-terminal domain-containing protein n=1 Tax=Methylobacterium sp. J-059 TaxID=2836643 RepID=UPI001FB90C05|nr:Mu transposase C-terminal domain-containing protein [Methylobacterium sp. J-059]MCJ2042234.1 Mu transposase C-terminal domain-containing protein [Methylobacterium sp. J-059]